MTSAAPVKISLYHAMQIERGLTDLRCACVCLDNLVGSSTEPAECSAILALVQKAGAYIEVALQDAGVVDDPAVVGAAADWLNMASEEGGRNEQAN